VATSELQAPSLCPTQARGSNHQKTPSMPQKFLYLRNLRLRQIKILLRVHRIVCLQSRISFRHIHLHPLRRPRDIRAQIISRCHLLSPQSLHALAGCGSPHAQLVSLIFQFRQLFWRGSRGYSRRRLCISTFALPALSSARRFRIAAAPRMPAAIRGFLSVPCSRRTACIARARIRYRWCRPDCASRRVRRNRCRCTRRWRNLRRCWLRWLPGSRRTRRPSSGKRRLTRISMRVRPSRNINSRRNQHSHA
jgi:hypothetical protein